MFYHIIYKTFLTPTKVTWSAVGHLVNPHTVERVRHPKMALEEALDSNMQVSMTKWSNAVCISFNYNLQ